MCPTSSIPMIETDVPHVYELSNGFYVDPFDGSVHVGNFVFFDETEQFHSCYDTLLEAEKAMKIYCKFLDGQES